MDSVIAHVAREGCIDAAHYTWVHLSWEKVVAHKKEHLSQLLLDHGDYAAPLRSEYIKLPFEHMAVVWSNDHLYMGPERQQVSLMVVSCVDAMPKQVDLWLADDTGKLKLAASSITRLTPEERAQGLKDRNKHPHFKDYGGNPEEQSLIRTASWMPKEQQANCVELLGHMVQKGFRYIAAASEGLLQGERIDYHAATSNPANAKRIKKGKTPLYEWRTVALERKVSELPAAPKGGTHASPRLHQRRGHWATSKLGKKFWRREAVVGNPENGMIFHDYVDQKDNHA